MPQEYNEQVYTLYFQLYDKMDSERKKPRESTKFLLEKDWINDGFLHKRNRGHKYLTYIIDLQGLFAVNTI